MITVSHLSKKFNAHTVVDDVSLTVDEGQIFGLLGPNAAGKTTTIRMMCGVVNRYQGQICIDGMSVRDAKSIIGYVAQHFGQYEELSVWENIQFYAQMYHVTDKVWLDELLDRYHLTPFKHQLSGSLSGGYQRRLALVCALSHNPRVLFLDEPTAGIDPVTRKLLWDDFYRLSAEGTTLFVTTHYMEEAQRCHKLAFISSGRIVAQGSPNEMRHALGDARAYAANIPYAPALRSALLDQDGIILVNQMGDELRLVTTSATTRSDLDAIIGTVTGKPGNLEVVEPSLEDVFIALTQEHEIKT